MPQRAASSVWMISGSTLSLVYEAAPRHQGSYCGGYRPVFVEAGGHLAWHSEHYSWQQDLHLPFEQVPLIPQLAPHRHQACDAVIQSRTCLVQIALDNVWQHSTL